MALPPPPALFLARTQGRPEGPRPSDLPDDARIDHVEATELTTGPWRPDAQHGGPPSALLGRSLEAVLPADRVIARVSIELVRPVPLGPLSVAAWATGVSRRVDHLHGRVLAGDKVVATAQALALAVSDVPEPSWRPIEPVGPDPSRLPRFRPNWNSGDEGLRYHRDGAELRIEDGEFGTPTPSTAWIRLAHPLVEGEEPSPLCRVLAAADFGSGLSAPFEMGRPVGMINADLTIALFRPLDGEWVRLASLSRVGEQGIGLGAAELGDAAGPIGRSTQSLLALPVG